MAEESAAGAGAEKVGDLYYEVTLDTSKMIAQERGASASIGRLETQLTAVAAAARTHVLQTQLEAAAMREAAAAAAAAAAAQEKLGASTKKSTEQSQKQTVSAKQTAAALRGVPAQVTDIVTSLQAGQNPLTVLLQQGGQLKDMFGGVLPAARALGGYIAGLVNVWTGLAAAVGLLAVAYVKGDQEQQAFQRSVILTGGAAGKTADQLNQMAANLDKVAGITRGQAAEALNTFIEAGVRGGVGLERFTKAALLLERAGGPAVDETAKAFKELEKSPTQAALKLNEASNFLTTSLYRQIKALEDTGRTAEAARVAQEAYAAAILSRAPQIEQNLGFIEKAWKGVKDIAREAWDAILGVGRADTPEQVLDATRQRIAALQTQLAESGGGFRQGLSNARQPIGNRQREELQQELESLQERLRLYSKSQDAAAAIADENARNAAQVKALAEFDKSGEQFLEKRARMERDIAKARELGVAAGRSEAEIQQRIVQIRRSYDFEGATLAAQAYYQGIVADSLSAMEKINAAEQQALTENARRMQTDRDNRAIYEKAKVAIAQKFARERALLEEKTTQEVAELKIATTLDETTKINAIREEEFRRADALQKLGVLTVQQAEAEKAKAVFKSVQDLQALRNRRQGAAVDTLRMRAESGGNDDQEALIRAQAAQAMAENEQMRQRDLEGAQVYADRRVAIEEDMNRKIAEMRSRNNQEALSATSDAFGAMTTVLRDTVGEQDGIYKAMFAAQKAFSIASSIVAIQSGIAKAADAPWPTNLAAMASVVAATANILGTIRGTNYGGGRQYGGPVSSGSLYRVNETGRPEMFTAANGSQYMLPTAGGQVTPANEVGGGGAVQWRVIINNAPPGTSASIDEQERTVTVAVARVAGQIANNSGEVWSALRSSTNVQGRL